MMVDEIYVKEYARQIFRLLATFAMMRSEDPEKQKALDRLQELRHEVEEILSVIAPGWEE